MHALKLMHLLCFVYWLGGDLGTFYASHFVARRELSPAARVTAARIMMGADLAPRVCMPLTLATGVHLAMLSGHLAWPPAAAAGVWTLCAAWLAAVLALHHADRSRTAVLARLDFAWRVLLVVALGAAACAALLGAWAALAPWLGLKLLCYTATVACGLLIRVRLRPFGPAFARLASKGADESSDHAIATSLAAARPFVVLIWGLLLLSAATGIHWVVV